MRNDTVCIKCKTIRNYFSETLDILNIVDCDENEDQCKNEIETYISDGSARAASGSRYTGSPGYPAALIGDTMYIGVTPMSLQSLTGCGQ